jgi:hypothetical protein
MAPGELVLPGSSPGEDYPNLDELLRQLPAAAAGHQISEIQRKILPRLGRYFLGKRDVKGECVSGVSVREIAYDIALNLLVNRRQKNNLGAMPDVVTLAGGVKASSKRQNSDESSTAESLERIPWPQVQ